MRHIAPYINLFQDTAFFYNAGKDITILEIGVARGMSTRYFLRGIANRHGKGNWGKAHLYSMDIQAYCSGNVNEPNKDIDWTYIVGDSKTAEWDKPIDILFIDGDHTYEGAKADFEKYSKFVKPGGIIFMHDVSHHRYGVKECWAEITLPKVVLNLNGTGLGIVRV
jgi:predicted O-methyltransferase YrrM